MEINKVPLKKATDWEKWLPIFLCVIFGLSFIFLFIQNISIRKQIKSNNNSTISSKQLSEELVKKEEEIKLCIEDRPAYGDITKKPYSYQEFGVNSPDFEGKEVEYSVYEYKRNKIIKKSIKSNENESQPWGITVWELDSNSKYTYALPALNTSASFGTQRDFPIFDGYENTGNPRWISGRMTEWKKQEVFSNKNEIKMYLSYNYAPKSIASVQYEFYNSYSTSGNQAFMVLWTGVKNYPLAKEITDLSVIEAKEALKKLANNIDTRIP